LKTIPVYESEGMILCHDITRIVLDDHKGPAFRKGHVVKKEDIPILLDIGKKNLFVWDPTEGFIHEDEAAIRISKAVAGRGISFLSPKEGKVEFVAEYEGLLKINLEGFEGINQFEDIMLASLQMNQVIEKGKKFAGTRTIPLVIEESIILKLEAEAKKYEPIIEIIPLKSLNIGIVTTGSEVYEGRIKDAFGPVLKKKIESLHCDYLDQQFATDDSDMIALKIKELISKGAEMVLVTGGMSVDPDDVTPDGIRKSGAEIVSYGAPVLPGAMFLLSYLGDIPIMGLPGCVMYHKASIFDLVFPRILAGEKLMRKDIIKYAHGGYCQSCETCIFPNCGFGK